MHTADEFRQEQRGVVQAMAGALAVTVIVAGTVMLTASSPARPLLDRLGSTVRSDTLVLLCLAAAIANVARLRFFSQHDIVGSSNGAASEKVRQASAILQNTLEQVVLAVGAHLVLTVTVGRSDAIVAALVGLFVAGRLLFWLGYASGARGRAFGFGLTFYPSVLALVVSFGSHVLRWTAI